MPKTYWKTEDGVVLVDLSAVAAICDDRVHLRGGSTLDDDLEPEELLDLRRAFEEFLVRKENMR